jgi:hypothetical protein
MPPLLAALLADADFRAAIFARLPPPPAAGFRRFFARQLSLFRRHAIGWPLLPIFAPGFSPHYFSFGYAGFRHAAAAAAGFTSAMIVYDDEAG